ncbi:MULTISPECIES: sensor histidine kinase [Enterocloster]|uniref:sensor histidine kinase n=1 Tax=Enterocloster TaxID=2719313 RepID=UPI000D1B3C5B|nr:MULTISPECIES: HAMP domain-containing sensor histidine kinase [Enterocloster]PST32103.1 hypothetical protein C7256_16685 [Enterocloster lavalensis]
MIDINLVLSLLMWIFALLIYASCRGSRINQWCTIGILVFSIGSFKEYLFFNVFAHISSLSPQFPAYAGEAVYSLLTAVLYYAAMPSALIFSAYFSGLDKFKPRWFPWAQFLPLASCACFMLLFNPFKTRWYQLNTRYYWYIMGAFNLACGTLMAYLMIHSIFAEHRLVVRRQKKMIAFITIFPIWYWLITIFVIHALRIRSMFKVWQFSLYIILVLLLFYVIMAFREGIMGLKLNSENYSWYADRRLIHMGARYTSHILKNELTKIDWCVNKLCEKESGGATPSGTGSSAKELEIISNSISHLHRFIEKTRLYSDQIRLDLTQIPVDKLLREAVSPLEKTYPNIHFSVLCPEKYLLPCDPVYTIEVLNNLFINAVEAMNEHGRITAECRQARHGRYLVLSVEDDGPGIPKENLAQLYQPYYSTKSGENHLGLGMFYCFHVMMEHGGYIQTESSPGKGTRISLYFPAKQRKARVSTGDSQ